MWLLNAVTKQMKSELEYLAVFVVKGTFELTAYKYSSIDSKLTESAAGSWGREAVAAEELTTNQSSLTKGTADVVNDVDVEDVVPQQRRLMLQATTERKSCSRYDDQLGDGGLGGGDLPLGRSHLLNDPDWSELTTEYECSGEMLQLTSAAVAAAATNRFRDHG